MRTSIWATLRGHTLVPLMVARAFAWLAFLLVVIQPYFGFPSVTERSMRIISEDIDDVWIFALVLFGGIVLVIEILLIAIGRKRKT